MIDAPRKMAARILRRNHPSSAQGLVRSGAESSGSFPGNGENSPTLLLGGDGVQTAES